MTAALDSHRKGASARAALFELACVGTTVAALVVASDLAIWLTFWPALLLSLVGVAALVWSEPASLELRGAAGSWHRLRPWIVLAVATLALSRAVADEMVQAALWLPLATAFTLRVVPRKSLVTATELVSEEAAPATSVAIEASNGDADRRHHVEYAQAFDASGLQRVTGVARLTFRPGERQTDVHLAFCPSFQVTPLLECHQSSGPNARIKIAQTMPYGARLEVQRPDTTSWAVITIDFMVAAPVKQRPAEIKQAS